MRKMIMDEGKKKLKISIYGRDLNNYLVFCNEKQRVWVSFDLKTMRMDKLLKNTWCTVKEWKLEESKKIKSGYLHFLVTGDQKTIEILNSLEN